MLGEGLLILSADTATELRSVAVTRGDKVLSLCVSELRHAGAANTLEEIARALDEASVKLSEVELFAVTIGPGSFTGLRSGLATMKAFSTTLKKPLVGVSTLHAIAHSARPAQRIAVMIPAGRGEVFAQVLSVSAAGEIVEQESPTHESPESFIERVARIGGRIKWAGSGSNKFSGSIRESANASSLKYKDITSEELETGEADTDEWMLAPTSEALALDVGALAKIQFESGVSTGEDELRALYVRRSDAELKEQCRAQS